MEIKSPPKVTSFPASPKSTSYQTDKGSKAYGPKATGPLPADPGKTLPAGVGYTK